MKRLLLLITRACLLVWLVVASASVLGSNASSYSVAGTADADGDGDGDEDILFRNNSSGANVLWIIQANAKAAANVLSTNAATMEAKFER